MHRSLGHREVSAAAAVTPGVHVEAAKRSGPTEVREMHMNPLSSIETSDESPPANRPATSQSIHPAWLRMTHWLNVVAVVIMLGSGWRVYNAAPVFGPRFPSELTVGGWLGGALQWHLAGMWLLAFNGVVYLGVNLVSGRFARKFFPIKASVVRNDVVDALRGRLSHADPRHYNGLQRLAYLAVILDLVMLVLSGLVLWKSVQFPVLRELVGGYESARRVHFFAMAALVAFVIGHLVMVALVPRSLVAMVRGR
jgi:thiosulfate reductase cytochrome b subunit